MVARKDVSGISMLEIVVSMVILAVVLAGLLSVFVASKGYVNHSRSRISAGELGKQFLDPLQNDVRQDTWNGVGGPNNLTVGNRTGAPVVIGGVTYTPQYEITDLNVGNSELRKVKININWNETK